MRAPRIVGIIIASALAGCTVGPDYKRPEIRTPDAWNEASAANTGPAATQPTTRPFTPGQPVVQWWTTFNDPTLNSLIDRAAQSSLDLRIAQARVREARALRRATLADQWPTVNGSASYRRSRQSENAFDFGSFAGAGGAGAGAGFAGGFSGIFGQEQDLWQAGFDANWELDIFGRVRRQIEAADADLAAADEGLRDVLVSLLAEVARNYIDVRGLQQEIRIIEQNIRAQQQTVTLTRERFRAGITGELDVVRAEAQVATTQSQLPVLNASLRRAIHRLGVLLGQPPAALSEELLRPAEMALPASAVPIGLPSDLLRRRSDVRRAERQLAAATARIGVATAALFPRFSLTGAAGLQSDRLDNIGSWESRFWSIGPGFTLPLFDRGRLKAQVQVQNERQEQALASYEQAVLRALEDVENALSSYANDQQRRRSLAEAVRATQRSVDLASELYTRGLTDFLTVLEAQRSLYASQDQLVQSERAVLADLVALYKALGGGWEMTQEQEGQADGHRGNEVNGEPRSAH